MSDVLTERKQGGKWVILIRSSPSLLDIAWANLTMALVGEVLDPEDQVCGVVASNRPKVDRIQVWTRGRDDVDVVNRIGRGILEAMGFDLREMEAVSMEFQVGIGFQNLPRHSLSPPPSLSPLSKPRLQVNSFFAS